jgi:hypothetical protein
LPIRVTMIVVNHLLAVMRRAGLLQRPSLSSFCPIVKQLHYYPA